jgi:methylated-DNA--[protein]-cysteine S-methyltransferase
MEEMIRIQYYQSPCGELILGSYKGKLCLCDWQNEERRRLIDERIQKGLQAQYIEKESETMTNAITQLDEYFNHRRKAFDIPLLFIGTDFQKSVWNELLNIPYGTTVSYAGLSERLGNPKAIRAVAAANGANAISIIVPCHRVIGSNQKLTGYAGGLPAKKLLLELESPMQSLL